MEQLRGQAVSPSPTHTLLYSLPHCGGRKPTATLPRFFCHMVPGLFLPMGGIHARVEVRKMVATILLLVVAVEVSPTATAETVASVGTQAPGSPLAMGTVPTAAVAVTTVNVGLLWLWVI